MSLKPSDLSPLLLFILLLSFMVFWILHLIISYSIKTIRNLGIGTVLSLYYFIILVLNNFDNNKGSEFDLNRWLNLPASPQSHVFIIKMDILLTIRLVSSVLPLPPPDCYWGIYINRSLDFYWDHPQMYNTCMVHHSKYNLMCYSMSSLCLAHFCCLWRNI